jgi:hypothetical protein
MVLFSALTLISTFSGTYAAIGPIATLDIVNEHILPDGFNRSWVAYFHGVVIY